MKLQDQVSNLSQSKTLHNIGIKYEGELFWVEFSSAESENRDDRFALCRPASKFEREHELSWLIVGKTSEALQSYLENYGNDSTADGDIYSALTVAELGVMLPNYFNYGTSQYQLKIIKFEENYYRVIHENVYDKFFENVDIGNTLASAMANHLIHLLESKLITADQVNKRLNP